jgi:hypothetical protein
MGIPVSSDFMLDFIKQRWGGVDDFAVEWAVRHEKGLQKVGQPRDRGSIYRWIKQGLPNRRDEVFGLCAALDVDPFCLIELRDDRFTRLFARERLSFLLNRPGQSKISALWPLVRPSAAWPDQTIAQDYFAREWHTYDFAHAALNVANCYAQIRLSTPVDQQKTGQPRTYYFAYRKAAATDGLWRPYGIVRQRGGRNVALAEMGFADEQASALGSPIDVETFFGPGPASFRIASLHPFEAVVTAPSTASTALRFPA